MKVVDSEDSEEFLEKSDADQPFDHETMWLRTYEEVFNTLSIDKNKDNKKWASELSDHLTQS